ncbi:hypothetical protein SEA_LUCKYSOCKE_147 [Streptomyces phage LuckySocke]|jgi:hypothetical protein|nr:hypothetical protein SEA_ALONE_150 [Streptomyces phage Alone3]WPH58921.1 hypothetical protein SEA_LUCKYSOCKE_147 [Streptomyces phage LuckySocke]
MAFKKSGTHLVIARSPEEAARNVLTYPYVVDYADGEAVLDRRAEVRERFGEEFDIFVVHTDVSVDASGEDLVRFTEATKEQ